MHIGAEDSGYLSPQQLAEAGVAEEHTTDQPLASHVQQMSEADWVEASPAEMAQHISLGGPKTDYAAERDTFREKTDNLANFWMDRIDSMDPALGQDVTSEFMNVHKT